MVPLNQDGKRSLGSGIAFSVLATVAVALRLLTKVYTKGRWAADDSWAIVSLTSLFARMGVEFWGIFAVGGGADKTEIVTAQNFATTQIYVKSLYMLDPLYALTVMTTRLSILYLYRRIFAVPSFRRLSSVIVIACIIWWIISTIVFLLPCIPIQKLWDPQREGHCNNFNEWFLSISIIDVILDIVILALPIKMVIGLQMSSQRRIILCFIFLLGSFVVITGMVRVALVYVPHSTNIRFTRGELWTNIHLGTAIVCASLPTYRPLFSHVAVVTASIRSRFVSIFSSHRHLLSPKPSGDCEIGVYPSGYKRYNQLGPVGEGTFREEATATQGSRLSEKFGKGGSQIRVKDAVDV